MKTIIKEQQSPKGQMMLILTQLNLWDYLFQEESATVEKKFSKPQAFYDLLQRQKKSIDEFENDVVLGNFQTFAKTWGWHRQTVKNFLYELASLGALTIDATTNRTVIKISNTKLVSEPAFDNSSLIIGQGHQPVGEPPP